MKKIKNATSAIVEKISKLPKAEKFNIGDYLKEYNFENNEKFELFKKIISLCEVQNIIIENTEADKILGMPWVYTYIKKN